MGAADAPPPAEPRIRAAATGDASDVAELLGLLGYPCTRDEAAERIAIVLGDPRQHLMLAEVDGMACGRVAMDLRYSLTRGADLARITALVVAPDSNRRGIGRRLLREVEAIARNARIARIEVTSNQRRADAHAFYRDCGYADGSAHFIKLLGD
ncbi:GNAT family N-acetyltransferase [Montanilutibacter psychrotolerans]|uniref:GNAT family N-acetyltransferase n=1 Tax=Montanilutibacter psychrotolerans TaxID=1327343 RepID=A0A3M8T111_9GAMM|nr:GNAT family N-acetyltransferase [Lysobacter psychrotolerans]RNF84382.1 GNAT family N-acetyltransferase [Lysobacter psychrotolerans]